MDSLYTVNAILVDQSTNGVALIDFTIAYSDPAFPGHSVASGGLIEPPAPLPATASNDDLILAIKARLGPQLDLIEAHALDSLRLQFLQATGVKVPKSAEPVDPLTLPMDRLTFWLVAASAGVSKWSVRDRIAEMPEGLAKREAIAWMEEAEQYRRYDPILIALAEAEGIPSSQLDALWAWAVA